MPNDVQFQAAYTRADSPCAAAQRIVKDTMVPIELFGEPWVLFRDEDGAAACVRDECAHRACPLSLGRVIDGRVQVRHTALR